MCGNSLKLTRMDRLLLVQMHYKWLKKILKKVNQNPKDKSKKMNKVVKIQGKSYLEF